MFNFSEIQGSVETRKNTSKRKGTTRPKGQNFNHIKVMTNDKKTTFTIANTMWDNLDLENKAFIQAFPQGTPVFVLVDDSNETATYFKSPTKGDNKAKTVKADILKDKLVEKGLLNAVSDADLLAAGKDGKTGNVYQYLKLVEQSLPENCPSDWLGLYTFEADAEGGNVKLGDSDDSDDNLEEVETLNEEVEEEVAEDDAMSGF